MVGILRDFLCKFVIMDSRDNSVAFSYGLLRHMRRHTTKDMRVLVLKVADSEDYGFFVAPMFKEISEEMKYPTIQYDFKNERYGFNCFAPSVAKIAYDWSKDEDAVFTCRVTAREVAGQMFYRMHKPR